MSEPKIYHNPINGEYTKIIKTSADTNGAFSLFEVSLNAGGGNPLHFHKTFSEEFFAVKGTLSVQRARKTIRLNPGESTIVNPSQHHRFFNETESTIIFRVKLTPAQPGFENFLKVLFGLVQENKTFTKNQLPKNIFYTAILYKWGDTNPVSPYMRSLTPVAKLIYKCAAWLGTDKMLLEKYCR